MPVKFSECIKALSLVHVWFVMMLLMLFSNLSLTDIDYFYHVRTGEYIYTQHAIPDTEVFSYTVKGKHWVAHEWLFEVFLYINKTLTGDLGIKIFTTALFGLATMITYLSMNKLKVKPWLSIILLVYTYWLCQVGFSPRPHLISYVFFTYYLYVLLSLKYKLETNLLWTLPVLMLLWTNAHGGYMLGIAILGLFLICEWLLVYMQINTNQSYIDSLKLLTKVGLITLIATGVKPTGYSEWLFPFQITSLKHINYVQEWQSPDFHKLHGKLYLILVTVFFVSQIYRTKKSDLSEILLPLTLLSLGFISQRHIPIATFALVIFIAISITDIRFSFFKYHFLERTGIANLYAKYVSSGKQIDEKEYLYNWGLMALIVLSFFYYYPLHQEKMLKEMEKTVPIKAYEFIENNKIEGKIFNSQQTGGYLISKLFPKQGVFIDGRGGDLYGDDFYFEYMRIYGLKDGWEPLFDKYDIDYMLINHAAPLGQILAAKNKFVVVYDDENFTVLVKNHKKYARVIQQHAKDLND